MSDLGDGQWELSVDLLRRSVEQGDELERLARGAHEIARVAIGQRDALAAVIEEARRNYAGRNYAEDSSDLLVVLDGIAVALSRAPSDVLVERDARIRAEVIDWAWTNIDDGIGGRVILNRAREHFGLTKEARRGE